MPWASILLTLVVAAPPGAKVDDAHGYPYRDVLAARRIRSDAAGVAAYLDQFGTSRLAGLIEQLGDESFKKREDAMRRLLAAPVLPVKRLRAAARGDDVEIRLRSLEILKTAGKNNNEQLVFAALRTIVHDGLDVPSTTILKTLGSLNKEHAFAAAREALVATARQRDVDLLRTAMKHERPRQRIAAVEALAGLLGREAVKDIRKMMSDKDDRVKLAATVALVNLGRRDTLAPLAKLVASDDQYVRARSAAALRAIAGDQFPAAAILQAHTSNNGNVAAVWQRWVAEQGHAVKLSVPFRLTALDLPRTLVSYAKENRLVEYDAAGLPVWQAALDSPGYCVGLSNGHRLVVSQRLKNVVEFDADGRRVWTSKWLPGVPVSVQRLTGGNTLVACNRSDAIVEIDRAGKLLWSVAVSGEPADARRLDDGRTLLVLRRAGCVVEIDRQGSVLWKLPGFARPTSAQRLDNGDTLVYDAIKSQAAQYARTGKIVWSLDEVHQFSRVVRAWNGNLIVGEGSAVRELDAERNIVWSSLGKSNVTGFCRYNLAAGGTGRFKSVAAGGENAAIGLRRETPRSDITLGGRDLRPGEPLSPAALVRRPTAVKGLIGWTIETRAHRSRPTVVKYDPKGRWIATAGADATVRLWNAASGRLEKILIGHAGPVRAIGWSADGKLLASGGQDATARLWEAGTGRLRGVVRVRSPIAAVAWTPDASGLALTESTGQVHFYHTDDGSESWVMTPTDCGLPARGSLAISPDGKTLLVGFRAASMLFDVATGRTVRRLSSAGNRATWSPDGSSFALQSADAVSIYTAKDGKLRHKLKGHGDSTFGLAWSTKTGQLATCGRAGGIRIYTADGKLAATLAGEAAPLEGLSWSPDGKRLIAGSNIWDIASQKAVAKAGQTYGGTHAQSVRWLSDGDRLLWNSGDSLTVWSRTTGAPATTLAIRGSVFALSPDEKRVAVAGAADGSLRLHPLDGKAGPVVLRGIRSGVTSLAWSPDGKLLACGRDDRSVRVWDVDARRVRHVLGDHQSAPTALAWSTGGAFLATGGAEKKIRVWDVKKAAIEHSFITESGIGLFRWSPDGKVLAAAHLDRTLSFWDVWEHQLLRVATGHQAKIADARWLDDESIATNDRKTIRYWTPRSRQHRALLSNLGAGQFSSDGKTIACLQPKSITFRSLPHQQPLGTLLMLPEGQHAFITPDGQWRGGSQAARHIVYVVETRQGQETLSPEEFLKRYDQMDESTP